jgi:scyllo-inositol 2-dehydrogenase (NADP+)
MAAVSPAGSIRTGIVGFGTSGRVFHAPFVTGNPDYSLDLIVTGDPERAAEARRLHPGARIVATPEELFAQADRLDLVVLGSPPATHAPLARRAIEAGLAVVVDKPFAVDSAEGAELVALAANRGVPLTVFQNRRWDGDFLTLRSLLRDGELGDVHRFESRFTWWKPQEAKSWKASATVAQGGGILFDLGTHLVDQAVQLFGDVDEVHAELDIRRPGGSAEDDAFVSLRHASGVRSHLWMSSLAAQAGPRFRVLGSRAGYTKFGLDEQEGRLKAGALPSDQGYGIEPESTWGVLGVDPDLRRVPTERGSYDSFYSLLADALLRDGALPVDPRDAVHVLELLERIRAAVPAFA